MHELTKLGRKYGTDKAGGRAGNHTFTEKVYGPLFEQCREDKLHLLEIGAGQVGGSHKMWKEYFTQGEIYCLDPFFLPDQIVTSADLEEIGVHVIQGNQLSRSDLTRAGASCEEGFDYIIDDAAHVPDAIQLSLGMLFPYLKSGGLYIVEDLATATRRGKSLKVTNTNLEKLDTQGLVSERHIKDYTLQESLTAFEEGKPWPSEILADSEKQYLTDHIQAWKILDDGHRLKNIALIKKK
mgnify:CR=1 FL=1|jgi:hypothetical protein